MFCFDTAHVITHTQQIDPFLIRAFQKVQLLEFFCNFTKFETLRNMVKMSAESTVLNSTYACNQCETMNGDLIDLIRHLLEFHKITAGDRIKEVVNQIVCPPPVVPAAVVDE
jgi:hypothetical protein